MNSYKFMRVKINGKKHLFFCETDEGYLFIIRHLVESKEEKIDFIKIYEREKVKICDHIFHVSDETFKLMVSAYFSMKSENKNKLPRSFSVSLHYD